MRPAVHISRKQLPGHIRQRIKRIIDELAQNPRPVESEPLELPTTLQTEWEARRIKIENWRVVYAVNEFWQEIGVLTVQKRPPYDYEDLELLLSELGY
ncbi:MAG: plasmid stabilization system [Anaerolineae bacterium]|nr:plasmid stabilization system [Anaerolineales bacterium]MCQ3974386.1 plasmid stabilization system [Anaerolineae bacterium]